MYFLWINLFRKKKTCLELKDKYGATESICASATTSDPDNIQCIKPYYSGCEQIYKSTPTSASTSSPISTQTSSPNSSPTSAQTSSPTSTETQPPKNAGEKKSKISLLFIIFALLL